MNNLRYHTCLCFIGLFLGALPIGWAQDANIEIRDMHDKHGENLVVVDREKGVYLGHPTTCLLEDGKTILCVYPKGHGRGEIVYKRSSDGGKTWSKRLKTPENWSTSKETPTLHRVVGPDGKKRVIMFSGLHPARLAVSENDGETWSPLKKLGDWGGIVVMSSVFDLKTGPGHYMALFHDDGRFFQQSPKQKKPVEFTLYKTVSRNGGLNWSSPISIDKSSAKHICEPGVIRSPDGKQLACLLRENSRRHPSQIIFSNDEGETWTKPRAMPKWLNGDRHTGKYLPDGRLFISYRCRWPKGSPKHEFEGDWVGWLGTYEDLQKGNEGTLFIRLADNHKAADCAYPGVEVLPDGTIVTTTYGHWDKGESPYVVSVRLRFPETNQK